jgi:hypothetical protein
VARSPCSATPAGSRALRHTVGYATQDASLYADLTVAENLRYFATLLGAPRSDPARVIGEVGLESARHQVASAATLRRRTLSSIRARRGRARYRASPGGPSARSLMLRSILRSIRGQNQSPGAACAISTSEDGKDGVATTGR